MGTVVSKGSCLITNGLGISRFISGDFEKHSFNSAFGFVAVCFLTGSEDEFDDVEDALLEDEVRFLR